MIVTPGCSNSPKVENSRLFGETLSVWTLLRKYPGSVGTTWLLTVCETALITLIPLLMGFAIDDLLANSVAGLTHLGGFLAALIFLGVVRRLFDTRAYGTIRVDLGNQLVARANGKAVSATSARLGMGRELADFLEEQVPQLLSSILQFGVALIILWAFHPLLFVSALVVGFLMLVIYAALHSRFFQLNGALNHQMEQQVGVLASNSPRRLWVHLSRLRKAEVKISDTEAFLYGIMFTLVLGLIVFNLWFAAANIEVTAGRVFSIVSYSWEFAEAALVFPMTLQSWSRLSEITQRINIPD